MSKVVYVSDDLMQEYPPTSPKNGGENKNTVLTNNDNQQNETELLADKKNMLPIENNSKIVSTIPIQSVSSENTKYFDKNNNVDVENVSSDYEHSDSDYISEGGDDVSNISSDDAASVSSLATDELLKVDPMYYRLTQFLQTGGMNVAEILSGIHLEMKALNENLHKLAIK